MPELSARRHCDPEDPSHLGRREPILRDSPAEAKTVHRSIVRSTYRRIDWLSHYDLLGLKREASAAEIDEAYRRLALYFDPALGARSDLADCGRELAVLSQRVRKAHTVLSDPGARKDYDESLLGERGLVVEERGEGAPKSKPDERSEQLRRWTASENYRRAKELIAESDFFPAIQMLENAVHFAPDKASYRLALGRAKMKNHRWREAAIEQLEQAARLEPNSSEIQGCLAQAYLDQGEPEKALPCARIALNRASPEKKGPYRDLEKRAEETAQMTPTGRHPIFAPGSRSA